MVSLLFKEFIALTSLLSNGVLIIQGIYSNDVRRGLGSGLTLTTMLRMSTKFFSVCSSSEVICFLALSSGQLEEGTFFASRFPWPSVGRKREREREREREAFLNIIVECIIQNVVMLTGHQHW